MNFSFIYRSETQTHEIIIYVRFLFTVNIQISAHWEFEAHGNVILYLKIRNKKGKKFSI